MTMTIRKPVEMIRAQPASDGAGVKMLRVFGGGRSERFDPFLMLDEFGSKEASDYIGGFPPHPHRGFETITYMLRGKMEHRDHLGNIGLLNDGDVQWMTAGRGIIHSEMPRQTEGQMRGFQVWLNLAAENKMTPAHYEDVAGDKLPRYRIGNSELIAIAGDVNLAGQQITGYFQRADTLPLYWDVHLAAGDTLRVPVPAGHTVLLYAYEGKVQLNETQLPAQYLLRLNEEGDVLVENPGAEEARFLLLAGMPLRQPIVQYGPFVMNTTEEIEQALADYRSGNFGRV
jgi:redox-sensitive bicupin YhaK (pirin superfamily)